jgi:transcriptional regulator with XRE-family HTH domain
MTHPDLEATLLAGSLAEIGAALRRRRLAAGFSLRELASRAEVSASFLSQVERGLTRPRLATLQRLASAFSTSMHALLGAGDGVEEISVVRAGEGLQLLHDSDPHHGAVRAIAQASSGLEAIEVVGAPPEFAEPYEHPGIELMYVISGEVEVDIGGQHQTLGPGDAISYPAHIPHRTRGVGGEVRLLIVGAHAR